VALVAVIGIVAFGATARAALTCERSVPTVTVDVKVNEPQIDNTLTQSALQQLAGVAYHRGRAEGLYKAKIAADTAVFVWRRGDRGDTCLWIEQAMVTITTPLRKIYIVRDRHPGTCNYEAVLGHERKHQAVDDALLREHVPLIRAKVEAAIAALPATRPVPLAQADAEERRLVAIVKDSADRAVKAMSSMGQARQANVDSAEEYRRIAAACR